MTTRREAIRLGQALQKVGATETQRRMAGILSAVHGVDGALEFVYGLQRKGLTSIPRSVQAIEGDMGSLRLGDHDRLAELLKEWNRARGGDPNRLAEDLARDYFDPLGAQIKAAPRLDTDHQEVADEAADEVAET